MPSSRWLRQILRDQTLLFRSKSDPRPHPPASAMKGEGRTRGGERPSAGPPCRASPAAPTVVSRRCRTPSPGQSLSKTLAWKPSPRAHMRLGRRDLGGTQPGAGRGAGLQGPSVSPLLVQRRQSRVGDPGHGHTVRALKGFRSPVPPDSALSLSQQLQKAEASRLPQTSQCRGSTRAPLGVAGADIAPTPRIMSASPTLQDSKATVC